MPSQLQPRYAIVNEHDAPKLENVVQLVPGFGYCYLDRTLSRFDGMSGSTAVDLEAFGWSWLENHKNGTVLFFKDKAASAFYPDGSPRRWQDAAVVFKYAMIASLAPEGG